MCSPYESLTQWPDGRVVCALCLDPKPRSELARDEDGHLIDVCRLCDLTDRLRAYVRDFDPTLTHAVALSPFGRPLYLGDFREILRRLHVSDSPGASWPAVSD